MSVLDVRYLSEKQYGHIENNNIFYIFLFTFCCIAHIHHFLESFNAGFAACDDVNQHRRR